MASPGPQVEEVIGRSIVSLKCSHRDAARIQSILQLADPPRTLERDFTSLWLGPDHWLLASDALDAQSMIDSCNLSTHNVTCNAVDCSSALAVFSVSGEGADELLAAGCGLDFRPRASRPGCCRRTRLARIAVIVVTMGDDAYNLYCDASFRTYLDDWLRDSAGINWLASSALSGSI